MNKFYLVADATGKVVRIGEEEFAALRNPLPDKATMAGNLLKAGADVAKLGLRPASEEEQKRRYGVCASACEFYRPVDGRCSMCGCWVKLKTKLEAWKCPDGRW